MSGTNSGNRLDPEQLSARDIGQEITVGWTRSGGNVRNTRTGRLVRLEQRLTVRGEGEGRVEGVATTVVFDPAPSIFAVPATVDDPTWWRPATVEDKWPA